MCGRALRIEDRSYEAVERFCAINPVERIIDDTIRNAVPFVVPGSVAGMNAAEVRSVSKSIVGLQPRVSRHTPQHVGRGCLGHVPHLTPKEVPVGQTQHLRQGRQHLFTQRQFARRAVGHLAVKQDVSAVLDQ